MTAMKSLEGFSLQDWQTNYGLGNVQYYDSYSHTNATPMPVTAQRLDKIPSKAVLYLMLFVPVQLCTLCSNEEK